MVTNCKLDIPKLLAEQLVVNYSEIKFIETLKLLKFYTRIGC